MICNWSQIVTGSINKSFEAPMRWETESTTLILKWSNSTTLNLKLVLQGYIRDYASMNELICLSNLENINSLLIQEKLEQKERLVKLNQLAIQQMTVLQNLKSRDLLR